MAIDKGWSGSILLGSSAKKTTAIAQINEWSLDWSMDALEKTNFGSTYDREYEPGLRTGTVSFSGYSEDSNNVQDYILDNFTATGGPYPTTAVHVVLISGYAAATTNLCGYKANALITGLTRGATPDGLQTFSGTLQLTGLISTYAT